LQLLGPDGSASLVVVVDVLSFSTAHLAADPLNDVVLVPAGERWPDGSLRPCLEDLLGAGAVAAALGDDDLSTEGLAAARLWRATPDPAATVRGSTSGRELTTAGWADDVTIAVDLDATDTVARLIDDGAGPAFRAA
jgi:2-phosphosulfolactate phosphatase